MHINKKSPIPVYYQLRNIILNKIDSGEYTSGDLIPSERELSDILKISRMTVRQALNQLVNEGMLFREKGKGTFVSNSKLEQINIMSFSETVKSRGMQPDTEILDFEEGFINPAVCDTLKISQNIEFFRLKRLRYANSEPVAIEEVYLPNSIFPNLKEYDMTQSLYSVLKDAYSQIISYMDNNIQASVPTKDERTILGITTKIPVLRISSVNFNETGERLFYENSIYRSDKYNYSVRIFRGKNF